MKSMTKRNNFLTYLPIIIFSSLVPLIVYLKVVELNNVVAQYWKSGNNNPDFFSYYKMVLISISAALGLITYFIKKKKEGSIISKYYIPILVFLVFTILSTLFSEHVKVSLLGFPDRYEGLLAIASYLIMTIVIINVTREERDIKVILKALMISALIILTIGIFQYFGMDLFKSHFGKKLILPSNYHHIVDKLKFKFGTYQIYSTMYNINYVGSYTAMGLPLSVALYILFKDKKYKIMMGLFSCLMFANWIGCRSRAGMLGGLLGFFILVIALRKQLRKNMKYILSLGLAFILIFTGMNLASGGALAGQVNKLSTDIGTVLTDKEAKSYVEDIDITDNNITYRTNEEILKVKLDNKQIHLYDGNDELIKSIPKDKKGGTKIEDDMYKNYVIGMIPEKNLFILVHNKVNFRFLIDNGNFRLLDAKGKVVANPHIPSFGFEGQERVGSGRGYIWSRTIPMLKDTFFIGYGPDTYAMYFPQNDIVGKVKTFGKYNIIVDKPHNMYFQTGVNTGVISLLALLAMFIMYTISSIRLYINSDFNTFYEKVGIGFFAAFAGYCLAGMFNDSLVSVAPIFWTIFGLGISTNRIIREKIN